MAIWHDASRAMVLWVITKGKEKKKSKNKIENDGSAQKRLRKWLRVRKKLFSSGVRLDNQNAVLLRLFKRPKKFNFGYYMIKVECTYRLLDLRKSSLATNAQYPELSCPFCSRNQRKEN